MTEEQRALGRDADAQNLLYHYTDHLYRAASLNDIYEAALTAICNGLHADKASILRFDASGVMRFVAWRGLSDEYRLAFGGHSPWAPGEQGAKIISIADAEHSAEMQPAIALLRAEDIRGLSFIPLSSEGGVVGKFMVYFSQPYVLNQKERQLALTIARQLGFAFKNYQADNAARRLAAVVESSNDAIISKTLNGEITSWNESAQRLFGYTPEQAIGQSINILIPDERLSEELLILESVREGRRVQSYETIRKCRDGRLVDVSLTISPVLDSRGTIIGASKIARDISERRAAAKKQQLLLDEMNHRVKNAYTVAGSLISLSVPNARTPQELASAVSKRLLALARAHSLTINSLPEGKESPSSAGKLQEVLGALLEPFVGETAKGQPRISLHGDDLSIDYATSAAIALLFHELATNAAKYGSLSDREGRVDVEVRTGPKETHILWQESGGPAVEAPDMEGFGSALIQLAARQIGEMIRIWNGHGVTAHIILRHKPSQ